MHVRHEAIFRWLIDRFPDSRLYGPYHHGGRSYYQWMARGAVLVRDVLPLLEEHLDERLDGHAAERLRQMTQRYAGFIEREQRRLESSSSS
jgi:glutathione S-transferase